MNRLSFQSFSLFLKTFNFSVAYLILVGCFSSCMSDMRAQNSSPISEEQREIFTVVEEQPSYQGGMDVLYNSIRDEIRYPLQARLAGIQGRVDIEFTIKRDGSLSNTKVLNGIGGGCDEEALRVFQLNHFFIPGSQRGRTVSTNMILPITFKINENKTNADNSPVGTVIVGQVKINNRELDIVSTYTDGKWTGIIRTSEGDLMPGASIVVDGTPYGTVSGLDGKFSVAAEEDQDLIIKYVGFENGRIKATEKR